MKKESKRNSSKPKQGSNDGELAPLRILELGSSHLQSIFMYVPLGLRNSGPEDVYLLIGDEPMKIAAGEQRYIRACVKFAPGGTGPNPKIIWQVFHYLVNM